LASILWVYETVTINKLIPNYEIIPQVDYQSILHKFFAQVIPGEKNQSPGNPGSQYGPNSY